MWHSSLTKKNRPTLERVQKAAVKVILRDKYTNYTQGLKYLKMETLDERRRQLCLKFAKKLPENWKIERNVKSEKKSTWHEIKKTKILSRKKDKYNKISKISHSLLNTTLKQRLWGKETNDGLNSSSSSIMYPVPVLCIQDCVTSTFMLSQSLCSK